MDSQNKCNHRQRWHRVALTLLVALAALTACLGLAPIGRAIVRAGLFVLDILPQSPISPLRTFTSPPRVEEIHFPYQKGDAEARLYRPAGDGPHSAMVFSLGYGPDPNDPLLVRVSDDLARLGIVVLIPNLPGAHAGNLAPGDVEVLVSAFEYLSTQPYVNPDHIGFAGFCIGSSLALVAAEDPQISQHVSYVNVFGGYYNARDMIRTIATRSSRYKDEELAWSPNHQTILLFVQNVLVHLDTSQDRQALLRLLQAPAGSSSATLSELPPLGRLGYTVLMGSDPVTVDALVAQIPEQELAELDLISPSTGIDRLRAKVFIMHDVGDPYVPVTESYRLADAISDPQQKVCTQFTLFDHVRPSRSLSWGELLKEAIKLFVYLCKLMVYITG